MRLDNIKNAVKEAKEFIKRSEAAISVNRKTIWNGEENKYLDTSRESGALRRQSMELTRALAEMRKP